MDFLSLVFSLLFLTSVSSFATSEINSTEIVDEVKNPVDNIVEIPQAYNEDNIQSFSDTDYKYDVKKAIAWFDMEEIIPY